MVCVGNSIPFRWDGDSASLPDGIDGVLPLAVEQHGAGVAPNTLCALQAVVVAAYQGQGLARVPIQSMADAARRARFADLVAPVRPSWKHRFPLIPMDRSRVVPTGRPSVRPMVPRACSSRSVVPPRLRELDADRRDGAGVDDVDRPRVPRLGQLRYPGALVPVEIDVPRDEGVYVEPNQWMLHPVEPR